MDTTPRGIPSSPIARRYGAFIERHAGAIAIAFLAITGLFTLSVRHLELHTDFEDLLPEGQPSVVTLRQIMKRVGGMGTLNVAIESPDKEASKRFVDDLVVALRSKMSSKLHSIDYTMAPIRKFYEKNGILYLSLEELRELDQALADAIHEAKLKANPLYVDLEDGEGDVADDDVAAKTATASGKTATAKKPKSDPNKRVKEIEAKARERAKGADKFPEGYYIGEKGTLVALFLRPNGSALEINGARGFISSMRSVVDGLHPERYHPKMRVNFTGSIQVTVEEHETIVHDLAGTALLCITLVALAVWLYFRRLRVLGLLGITLVGGAVWSFGLASLTSGSVNAQTAFLGTIIVGTGINYGILILGRYLEERRGAVPRSEALATALGACFKPTLVAALATGISFGGLGIAHIRSFSQFGFIGGVGIVLCWILSYTVLPALLSLLERIPWLSLRAEKKPRLHVGYPAWLARLPVKRAGLVAGIFGVLVAVSLGSLVWYLPRSLETDINNLRNKPSVKSGTNVLDNRVGDMMGESLTPALVLADTPDQAIKICKAFDKLRAERAPNPPIEWCRSIHGFLPDRQDEKLAVVTSIRDRLEKTPRNLLPEEVQKRVEDLRGRLDVRRLEIPDLPDEIRRRFREKNGTEGTLTLVQPSEKLGLYIIENLYAFTNALREIRLDDGAVVHSSGDTVVFADILRSIGVDAPRTTVLAAAGVLILLFVVLRRGQAVARVSAALGAGMALMLGVAAALGLRFNFLNFVAIPTTLGIGVDYPINIHWRHVQEGPGTLERVLLRTGPAVFIASLTTIIGYGVLCTSNSMALVSFGKLAILGEFTCLAAALLFLPALSTLVERRHAAAAARAEKAGTARAAETVNG
jgi:uncharacterized protein